MRRGRCVLCLGAMLLVAGCGGDDGGDETAASGAAPKPETVLKCMQAGGLEAEDQSSSTGPKIGVDYPAGRLIVSFEESEEDAKLRVSVAKSQEPGSRAVQKGTVVITAPADSPDGEAGARVAQRCVEMP